MGNGYDAVDAKNAKDLYINYKGNVSIAGGEGKNGSIDCDGSNGGNGGFGIYANQLYGVLVGESINYKFFGGAGGSGGQAGKGGNAGQNGADGKTGEAGNNGQSGKNSDNGNDGYNTTGNINGIRKMSYGFRKEFIYHICRLD
jgi:hypothetical protein